VQMKFGLREGRDARGKSVWVHGEMI
jgi:hypothetical protein